MAQQRRKCCICNEYDLEALHDVTNLLMRECLAIFWTGGYVGYGWTCVLFFHVIHLRMELASSFQSWYLVELYWKWENILFVIAYKPPPTWLTRLEDNHQEALAKTILVYVDAHFLDQSKHFKLKPFYALWVNLQNHTLNMPFVWGHTLSDIFLCFWCFWNSSFRYCRF